MTLYWIISLWGKRHLKLFHGSRSASFCWTHTFPPRSSPKFLAAVSKPFHDHQCGIRRHLSIFSPKPFYFPRILPVDWGFWYFFFFFFFWGLIFLSISRKPKPKAVGKSDSKHSLSPAGDRQTDISSGAGWVSERSPHTAPLASWGPSSASVRVWTSILPEAAGLVPPCRAALSLNNHNCSSSSDW